MANDPIENEQDPGASTQMFRAFVDEGATAPAAEAKTGTRTVAITAGIIVLVLIIVVAVVLL